MRLDHLRSNVLTARTPRGYLRASCSSSAVRGHGSPIFLCPRPFTQFFLHPPKIKKSTYWIPNTPVYNLPRTIPVPNFYVPDEGALHKFLSLGVGRRLHRSSNLLRAIGWPSKLAPSSSQLYVRGLQEIPYIQTGAAHCILSRYSEQSGSASTGKPQTGSTFHAFPSQPSRLFARMTELSDRVFSAQPGWAWKQCCIKVSILLRAGSYDTVTNIPGR